MEIWVRLPHEWSQTQRAELLGEELRRARELLAAGTIHRIWRVPGALHNVGIWRAATPDEIHDAITSLPCFPYLDAIVTALASHPAER